MSVVEEEKTPRHQVLPSVQAAKLLYSDNGQRDGRPEAFVSVGQIEEEYRQLLDRMQPFEGIIKFDFGSEFLVINGTTRPVSITRSDVVADCTVTVTTNNLLKIIKGELRGQKAFATGLLKAKGSVELALTFHSMRKRSVSTSS